MKETDRYQWGWLLLAAAMCLLGALPTHRAAAQSRDSIYFGGNLVYHADRTPCSHVPPEASFMVFVNDRTKILLETAPRWGIGDPNIPGKGWFGVELANFVNPSLKVGDSVFVLFTCVATAQQGLFSDQVSGIPWGRFPLIANLSAKTIPSAPQGIALAVDQVTRHRTITWMAVGALTYSVYRRNSFPDTVAGGQLRRLYTRLALGVAGGSFTDTTGLASSKYGYVVFAVNANGVTSVHSQEVSDEPVVPPGDDLTVGYIGRLPRLDYVWASQNPETDGWPSEGSQVTWQAVVKNWSTRDFLAVPYKWYLDGVPVDSGTVDVPSDAPGLVNLPWMWTFMRHDLKFVIDPDNIVPEEEEQNNELTIYTNAIGVGFYVEKSVYEYFHQYQKLLPNVHSNCWEDWAQRHVRRWNQMFASAVFPETQNGVLDRIRIDKITVVPDRALPLAGGLATNNPNMNDRTVDLQWGFPIDLLNGTFYANHTTVSDNNAFYFEGSLLHELGHARYLVDVYGFNVEGGTSAVAITEGGQFVAGSQYMPDLGGTAVYRTPILGLMNSQYTYVDRYSASALNLIAGHRAIKGNYNAPDNIGVFLQDLPAQNRLTVKDAAGAPLAGAGIRVYQATGRSGVWYGKYFDDAPDLQLTCDANGQVLLGRCPFSASGFIQHDYGISNVILILRVIHGQKIGYGFLECSSFNLEYWRGHTAQGDYEIKVTMIGPSAVDQFAGSVPTSTALEQNYPNPFNSNSEIRYLISDFGNVRLVVYDMLGREVRALVNEQVKPGIYQVRWDGRNSQGEDVSSGVYLCRMDAGSVSITRKMVMMR